VKYNNKHTNKLKKEMARRRGKQILGKSGEHLGGFDNTMAQQTGQGKLARSSAIAVGKIANVGDKLSKNIDPENITDNAKIQIIKRLKRSGKISEEEAQKRIKEIRDKEVEESIEFFEDNGLKVKYNNKTMNIKEFLNKAKNDSEISSCIETIKNQKESEEFNGSLIQYIVEKLNSERFVVNKEVNNVS